MGVEIPVSEQETRQLHRRELLLLGLSVATLGAYFLFGLLLVA